LKIRAFFLLVLGLSQIIGTLFRWPALTQLSMATAASPAPQIFCRSNGVESFACHYFLDWKDLGGSPHTLALGPSILARIPGPLARRSMYLRIMTGDWNKPDSMTGSVKHYALCGPLLGEMGIDRNAILWPAYLRTVTPGVSLFSEASFPLEGGCP